MDPVLQFQPWLEFNRAMLRRGRLPLWNDLARAAGRPTWPTARARSSTRSTLIAYLGTLPEAYAWMAAGAALGRRAGDVPAGAVVGPGRLGTLVRRAGVPVLRLPGRLAALPGHERRGLDALAASGRPTGCSSGPGRGRSGGWPWSSALVLLGGHVQTSAHVLLAARRRTRPGGSDRARGRWPRPVAALAVAWAAGTRRWASALAARRGRPAGGLPGAEPGLGRSRSESGRRLAARDRPRAARRGLHGAAVRLRQPAAGASQPGAGAGRAQPERVGGRVRRAGDPDLAGPAGAGRRDGGSRAWLPRRRWRPSARWARSGSRRSPTCSGPCRSWT